MTGCNLFVVPPHTEAIVFSVDGALAANFSIMGKDIRAKPGAMAVARLVSPKRSSSPAAVL